MNKIIIAIDGPSASGKSTTAKLVAKKLGYIHLDTGAMYRAITFAVINSKIDLKEIDLLKSFVSNLKIRLQNFEGKNKIYLNDVDVSDEIRSPLITEKVSLISSYDFVRALMVKQQKEIGKVKGVVCEGRDIGTVVFSDAEIKIFLVASISERAKRRMKEFSNHGFEKKVEDVINEINYRDELDSTRENSPLRKAVDAIEINTTNLSIDEQVEIIYKKAIEKINDSNN